MEHLDQLFKKITLSENITQDRIFLVAAFFTIAISTAHPFKDGN